jgi:hypothetical protein
MDDKISVFNLPQQDRDRVLSHAEYLLQKGYMAGDLIELANFLASKEVLKEHKPEFIQLLMEKVNTPEEIDD